MDPNHKLTPFLLLRLAEALELWPRLEQALLPALRSGVLALTQDETAPIAPAPRGAIRVACVGDSITYGSTVKNRARNCYPARLQALLGTDYAVRNFGASGYTLMKSADLPYWTHPNFRKSSEFAPDLVLIMLGTNDSKHHNWTTPGPFTADYRALVRHYRALPSHPAVYALTPPTAYTVNGSATLNFSVSNEAMDAMSAAIQTLAEEEHLPVIDIRAATANHPECFPQDGVHANAAGAALIAQAVYRVLMEMPA